MIEHITHRLCLCGCGREVTGRKGQKYFDRLCKDRARHRRERQGFKEWRERMDLALEEVGLVTTERR